jgi:hypothetical protein
MVKWIWKIYSRKESLWVRLFEAKYMRNGDFFKSIGVTILKKKSTRLSTYLNVGLFTR